jgi:hypothetical protein
MSRTARPIELLSRQRQADPQTPRPRDTGAAHREIKVPISSLLYPDSPTPYRTVAYLIDAGLKVLVEKISGGRIDLASLVAVDD